MNYYIEGNILKGKVNRIVSPHKSAGNNVCDFVVMHYTGSHGNAESSNKWTQDPTSKVSWHITIDRDGSVTQVNDFRTICWHAGQSEWLAKQNNRQYKNMNGYSIGIELANAGLLTRKDGKWKNPYNVVISDANVFVDGQGRGWEKFPDVQLKTAFEVALVCAQRYNCVDILGHSEISPGRKVDPGSAFPLNTLKQTLYSQSWYKFKK